MSAVARENANRDYQGTDAIQRDAPTGDFTGTPDEVAAFLQDRV